MNYQRKLVELIESVETLPRDELIEALNMIKQTLHEVSPFKNEPVDCVLWKRIEEVVANDYNPNSVAPPEMKLLEISIDADGYTQPVVADYDGEKLVVVDGFHRNRVARESEIVKKRILGYLPIVQIRQDRKNRSDRIASTIRHNRARGKHQVSKMSDIVIELKKRNWSEERIGRELGMDPDEVLRLCQVSGIAEVFRDKAFTMAWEAKRSDSVSPGEEEIFSDIAAGIEETEETGGRIFHTWEKWECYRHGFYSEHPPKGMTQDQAEDAYAVFLADLESFEEALKIVVAEWRNSCEHYLTNERMNRVAWLGQAAAAQSKGLPACCREGYNRLTPIQKKEADALALVYLNKWLTANKRSAVDMVAAYGRTEADLY